MIAEAPRATLASQEPYPVPAGARLVFRYVVFTTDGFMRGDVSLAFGNGAEECRIARHLPVQGSAHQVRVIGDYARLFPDPIPVQPHVEEDGASA